MNTIAQGLLLPLRKGMSNLSVKNIYIKKIKKLKKNKLNYYSNNDLVLTVIIIS